MASTMEKISSNKVRILFEVEPAKFEEGMVKAYRKAVGRINIPGFRRGKAPRKVIEMQYGESIFYEDALDAIFPELYDAALEEHKLDVVDRPSVEVDQIGGGEPLKFSCEVFVRPDVTLGQYKGVEVHAHDHPVTDEQVEAQLEQARERVARFEDIEGRALENGDEASMDYAGFVGDEQFEGGTAQDQKLVIGSGNFIPGFEEKMIGMTVGEQRDIEVTFPEEYHAENLAGKPAVFHVTLNAIRKKELPDLDDEFAKDVSEFDTLDEYRADIRAKLEKDAAEHMKTAQENAAVDKAVENAEADIPEPMIERQIDQLLRDMEMRMMYQGLRMQDFLTYTGQTIEQLREQYKVEAERRVKTRLVLDTIRAQEAIEADEAKVEEEIARYAEQMKKTVDEIKADLAPEDWEGLRDSVASQAVVDMLRENAVILADEGETHE